MAIPTSDEQVRFLVNLQRLLAEGQFVATYKYALLNALADIAVESGKDTDDATVISTAQIAEKFVGYYWRQSTPYARGNTTADILKQNIGSQAGIVKLVQAARSKYQDSLTAAKRNKAGWGRLVSSVNSIVKQMPLWKLQTVGGQTFDFLYSNTGRGSSITLRPGIAYCLRKFHPLVTDLVRGAWLRYVRRFNAELVGPGSDLQEFLFGSERADLKDVAMILRDQQQDRCFYCAGRLNARTSHVDHFIPWSRYPVDLGHNFVLAHHTCNINKSDRLAAVQHLDRWVGGLETAGSTLTERFNRNGIVNDLPASIRIADWAYQQTSNAGGSVWLAGNQLIPLGTDWKIALSRVMHSDN